MAQLLHLLCFPSRTTLVTHKQTYKRHPNAIRCRSNSEGRAFTVPSKPWSTSPRAKTAPSLTAMPDPNVQSYIASHYLSGPKADAILARTSDIKVKRSKKKHKSDQLNAACSSAGGLVFKDDSDGWKAVGGEADEEDALEPQVVGGDAASFSKAFRKIGSSKNKVEDRTAVEASAEASQESTLKPGLRTKEEMKAARLAREQRELVETNPTTSRPSPTPQADNQQEALAQQTVYRDASGRKINIEAHQAAQRQLELERATKAAERSTWSQGLVQKQQRSEAKARLASVQTQSIARRATDDDYNRHFKQMLHHDDPALAFLTKKRKDAPRRPKYQGNWPPNRFGIAPGYRWDGVDRGNGFEKAFFERKAVLAQREQEARAWGQSDM